MPWPGRGLAVDPLERDPPGRPVARRRREGREREPDRRLVRQAEARQRAAAALEVEDRRAVDEHDVRAVRARGAACARLGPGERGTVRLRRVGGREDERLRLVAGLAQVAQPLDGAGQGELRAAEPLDEVAAPRALPTVSSAASSPYMRPNAPVPPSARSPGRVTTPWRSSAISARARARSASLAPAKSGAARLKRPATAGGGAPRRRWRRRPPPDAGGRATAAAAGGAPRRRARSGANASFVTSPAQTSSQSAASTSEEGASTAAARSPKKRAPPASTSRTSACSSPSAGTGAGGGPSRGASSRK